MFERRRGGVVVYEILYAKSIRKDIESLKAGKLDKKAKILVELLKENPYQNPPPYEKLVGDMQGFYLRRINRQHRLVYQVREKEKIVKVLSMWSHYENIG